jgi:hypothetical protein
MEGDLEACVVIFISLEFRVSAALSAPSGVKFFVACCHFRMTARPLRGRAS